MNALIHLNVIGLFCSDALFSSTMTQNENSWLAIIAINMYGIQLTLIRIQRKHLSDYALPAPCIEREHNCCEWAYTFIINLIWCFSFSPITPSILLLASISSTFESSILYRMWIVNSNPLALVVTSNVMRFTFDNRFFDSCAIANCLGVKNPFHHFDNNHGYSKSAMIYFHVSAGLCRRHPFILHNSADCWQSWTESEPSKWMEAIPM